MKRGSSPSTRHRALYYVATPPPELAAWVECLWELSPGRRAGQLEVWEERIPAELGSDLVISLGTAYQHRVGNSSALVSGRHCLGVRQQPEHFIHRMSNHLVGIRLRPGAAAMLLRRHGADLQGAVSWPKRALVS